MKTKTIIDIIRASILTLGLGIIVKGYVSDDSTFKTAGYIFTGASAAQLICPYATQSMFKIIYGRRETPNQNQERTGTNNG